MKKIFLLMSLLMLATVSFAIPARPGIWKSITLSNGKVVRVQLMGDEFNKFYKSDDGQLYVPSGNTYEQISAEALSLKTTAKRQAMNEMHAKRRSRLARSGKSGYFGNKRCLIILVQFQDKKFADTHTKEFYQRLANEENFSLEGARGSVRDYFKAQSGGQLNIDFDIAGPYTLPENYAYYGGNGASGNDAHAGTMVATACKMADADVNFANYSWNNDGTVDQIYVLYAGYGEATSHDSQTVWPHMYYLSASDYGRSLQLDGVTVNTYACGCEIDEINQTSSPHVAGIGTICHEFSHCLGFPDFYDTVGRNFGMGNWDILSSGSYNGDTFRPAGYTSYEKWIAGWLAPIELNDEDESIRGMKALADGGDAYIIYNNGNLNEFYMVENRQNTGWDSDLPGRGLIVTHVDYDRTAWSYNRVNTVSGNQRMTIFHADNMAGTSTANQAGDAYPYDGNDELTNSSVPAATLHTANEDGTYYMNKGITGITQAADGTISFDFHADTKGQNKPDDVVKDVVRFSEAFKASRGTGGNDNTWGGMSGQGTFASDNSGWTSDVTHGGNQCALFGNRLKAGEVTSPEFTLTGADATIDIAMAPWAESSDQVSIYLNDQLLRTVTLPAAQWTTVSIGTKATGACRIRLVPTGRLWVNSLTVTEHVSTSGIAGVTTDATTKRVSRIYSLDGTYVGRDFSSLRPGVYIVNGKKIVK